MAEFTTEVRRLMAERGMSLRALARATPCDPSQLSRILSGKQQPSKPMAAALDIALKAGGSIRRATVPAGTEAGEAIAWARRNPRRAGPEAFAALGGLLAGQRRTEDALGSAAILKPVLTQLATVEAIVREARGSSRLAAVHLGAQWAQFAGWLYMSTGKQSLARSRLSQGLEWAVEGGDRDLLSEVLSFQGHAAYLAGDAGAAIGLSQAARRDAGTYPGQLAISAAQEAKGHAIEGSARDADRLLDESDDLAEQARQHADEAPPWLYYHTDGFFDLQRGEVYAHLAASPHYRQRAVESITAGYAALPPDAQCSEWAAEYLVRVAVLHTRGGDAEQASAAAIRAAAIARATSSVRLFTLLRRLRAEMDARWPGAPEAIALDEALH